MAQHRTGFARLGVANRDGIIRRLALTFGPSKGTVIGRFTPSSAPLIGALILPHCKHIDSDENERARQIAERVERIIASVTPVLKRQCGRRS